MRQRRKYTASGLYVAVAVIDKGQLLLIRREEDKEWGLPGRKVWPGAFVAHAAVQIIRAETGLQVKLTRLVGIYTHPYWPGSMYGVVFTATPVGGILQSPLPDGGEIRYFPEDALPKHLLWWHQRPIQEALSGIGSAAWMRLME